MSENHLGHTNGQAEPMPNEQERTDTTVGQPVLRRTITTEEVLEQLRRVIKPGSLKPYVGKPEDRNTI